MILTMKETREDKAQRMKFAEALAHEIATELRGMPHTPGRVRVYFDQQAETWAVRVTAGGHRYELTMPAPGAYFGLFRNGTWAGLGVTSHTTPAEVAHCLAARISHFR